MIVGIDKRADILERQKMSRKIPIYDKLRSASTPQIGIN
jgi:hypothetical protein